MISESPPLLSVCSVPQKFKSREHEQWSGSCDSSAKWLNNDTVDFLDQSLFAIKQDLYAIADMSLKRGRQLAVSQMQ